MSDVSAPPRSLLGRMLSIEVGQFRYIALCAAVVFYALAGSPTPNHPGLFEALIGCLLLLAVGWSGAHYSILWSRYEPLWIQSARLLLLFGASVPVLLAVFYGHSAVMMLRDIVPFLFMLLPLFLYPLFLHNAGGFRFFIALIVFAGFVYAGRDFIVQAERILSLVFMQQPGELMYLANAPTVLFAAVFSGGKALQSIVYAVRLKHIVWAMFYTLICAVCLAAMAMSLQRASLGYFVLSMCILCAVFLHQKPGRTVLIMAVIFLVTSLFFAPGLSFLFELTMALLEKTALHGFNNRFLELWAVISEISHSAFTMVFGLGWGAMYESPAVGDMRVNYTHGLFSSMLLKTGLTGLVLSLAFVGLLLGMAIRFFRDEPILALALIGPVIVNVFLYASFKSLDFGLILALIIYAHVFRSAHAPETRLIY